MNLAKIIACFSLAACLPGLAQDVYITHGPILGRLESKSIGVWVRTSHPADFFVKYGLEPGEYDRSIGGTTRLAHDNTGWVEITGLVPDTKYYYVVETELLQGLTGSFKTLPDNQVYRDPKYNPEGLFNFAFEFACGNNQNAARHGSGPELPTFATLVEKEKNELYFSIQNGDWLYEERREFSPAQWQAQNGIGNSELPEIIRYAPTITGVWENYKLYLHRGKNLAEFHRYVPCFFTFDDHEILNDVYGSGEVGLQGDRRAVFRDIAIRAWYDYLGWSNPIPFSQDIHFGQASLKQGETRLVDTAADFTALDWSQLGTLHVHWGTPTAGVNDKQYDRLPGDPNAGVYRVDKVIDENRLEIFPAANANGNQMYSIARKSYFKKTVGNCDFFVLDTRSERGMHDAKDPWKKGLTMLGLDQQEWLLRGIAASNADFIFVVSSVNLMIPHVGGSMVRDINKNDAWVVFMEEREKLIDAWDRLDKPVFVLTGDLHNSFVIKITDNVWEFASAPRNSGNHWNTDEGDRPATGKFVSSGRECGIRWSTWFSNEIPRKELRYTVYCKVQVNNVFNNAKKFGETKWVAYERPQVIFQYFDGRTGKLLYAESITAIVE